MLVDRTQVTEYKPGYFSTFASDLGINPRQFYANDEFETNLGNGMKFIRTYFSFEVSVYTQLAGGIELRVYND